MQARTVLHPRISSSRSVMASSFLHTPGGFGQRGRPDPDQCTVTGARQRCGKSSSIRLAGCIGSRCSTSFRYW